MRRKALKYILSVLMLVILLAGLHAWRPAYSQSSSQASASDRVLVDASDAQAIARLRSEGWQQMVDYGSFSLWGRAAQGGLLPQNLSGVTPVDDSIYLRDITLHPGPAASSGPAPAQAPVQSPGMWIVQFIGPPQPAWLDALRASGLEIVSYLPNNAYLVWGNQAGQTLAGLSASDSFIQWSTAYLPEYRLAPSLRSPALSAGGPVEVTIQFYNSNLLTTSLDRLQQLAGGFEDAPVKVSDWTNIRVRLTAQALADVSTWPDVINIEPYQAPKLMDEIQGQILAGNTKTGAGTILSSGPGYLNWLARMGFPTNPAQYPLVALFDDGLDSGNAANILHPDFYVYGDKTRPSRVAYIANCTSDSTANGVGGHGDLNAGILAGYNNRSGAPYQDPLGYHLGLGISPYGRIAATKIFSNGGVFDLSRCSGSFTNMVDGAYARGARITSNSWGASVSGDYDSQAQAYDALTRDASSAPGNQGMLHIFAAGNYGPEMQTIGSPGTAKNVLTVGATESTRAAGVEDGCLVSDSSSADNLAIYSARGPTRDGRIKPDIMAPGTHIQGPAAQDPAFDGHSICGGYTSTNVFTPYYPGNQKLYTWSSGTSHATPAISGVAQLVYNDYQRVLKPGATPSPAMIKALILNAPRYLTGKSANDTLPSPNQGWGDADMSQIFDGLPHMLFDQEKILTSTGQTFTTTGYVTSATNPLRITLAWTDAPGQPAASVSAVNNLDLEVSVQGKTYRGNVMSGQYSIPDGTADSRNNVESVFLPAGIQGAFTVRVIARCLAGDGVPGNSSLTDQDFALVINNATPEPLNYHTWLMNINR